MILITIAVELAQVEERGRKVDFHSVREGKDAAKNHSSVMNTQDITLSDQERKNRKKGTIFMREWEEENLTY